MEESIQLGGQTFKINSLNIAQYKTLKVPFSVLSDVRAGSGEKIAAMLDILGSAIKRGNPAVVVDTLEPTGREIREGFKALVHISGLEEKDVQLGEAQAGDVLNSSTGMS